MFIFLVSKQFLDYLLFNNSLKNILVAKQLDAYTKIN